MPELPVAVVSGAGSGIGLAVSRMLASRGFALVLNGRSPEPLKRAAIELAHGAVPQPVVVPGDMGVEADVHRLIDTALTVHERIDVLVNNAGASWSLPLREHEPSMVRRCFEVNAMGPAWAILRAWPAFERQRTGCVINVSSRASLDPLPGFFGYAPSKAALDLLALVTAREGAAIGVRAFSIAPGAVETPLLRSVFDTSVIPREACLEARDVAELMMDCIEGRRDPDNGRVIDIWLDRGKPRIELRGSSAAGGVHLRA